MFAKSILAVAFLAGAAIAQSSTSAGTATIVTSAIAQEVSGSTKASWCNSQQRVCMLLCNNQFQSNTCDPTTLTYNCLCNNGTAPGLQYYKDTIDYNTCQRAFSDCIKAHPDDQAGQDLCKSNILARCGMLDVASFTAAAGGGSATTSSAAGAGSTTLATTTAGGSPSSTSVAPATTTSPGLAANGKEMSAGILGAGLIAAFGFLL